ncbi:MAG: DUF1467 family protein [Alphaproteobacteria bacterium]|nr:DUF1467 family protein [Pseudomonadota bacterium]
MGAASIFLVFVIVWWLVFFMVLPHGIRTPDKPDRPGTVESAPIKPRLWLKAAITTGIATVITGIIVGVVEVDFLTFVDVDEAP